MCFRSHDNGLKLKDRKMKALLWAFLGLRKTSTTVNNIEKGLDDPAVVSPPLPRQAINASAISSSLIGNHCFEWALRKSIHQYGINQQPLRMQLRPLSPLAWNQLICVARCNHAWRVHVGFPEYVSVFVCVQVFVSVCVCVHKSHSSAAPSFMHRVENRGVCGGVGARLEGDDK